jgi:hypothetical protein
MTVSWMERQRDRVRCRTAATQSGIDTIYTPSFGKNSVYASTGLFHAYANFRAFIKFGIGLIARDGDNGGYGKRDTVDQ